MVVVLPDPLTPMTRMTCGRGKASISSGWATGASTAAISSANIARNAASSNGLSKRPAASRSRIRAAIAGPRSAVISASSMRSRSSSSSDALPASPTRFSPSRSDVRFRPPNSRSVQLLLMRRPLPVPRLRHGRRAPGQPRGFRA